MLISVNIIDIVEKSAWFFPIEQSTTPFMQAPV